MDWQEPPVFDGNDSVRNTAPALPHNKPEATLTVVVWTRARTEDFVTSAYFTKV